MTIFLTFIMFLFGLFPAIIFSNFSGAQSKGRDTVRRNDINSIYQKLEEHHLNYGDYPTINELALNYEEKLPGIDREAIYDENGVKIGDPGSEYDYDASDCNAIGCQQYELSAVLEDGSKYTKKSLN